MSRSESRRLTVFAQGDEGRFLEWHGTEWRVFEYHNYGTRFEDAKLTENDFRVLRTHFGLIHDDPPDDHIKNISPDRLRTMARSDPKTPS